MLGAHRHGVSETGGDMPDEWGDTLLDTQHNIYAIRSEIEWRWRQWAQRVHHRTGDPTDLLNLKEFQKQ